MKTKRPLWSRVVVAVIAFLWPLFLYQSAAVLYLNVDVAIIFLSFFWVDTAGLPHVNNGPWG